MSGRSSPQRNSQEVNLPDPEQVEEILSLAGQVIEGVGSSRNIRSSMPHRVVTKYAKVSNQGIHLKIPERQVGCQRMAEHENRGRMGAFQLIVDLIAFNLDLHFLILGDGVNTLSPQPGGNGECLTSEFPLSYQRLRRCNGQIRTTTAGDDIPPPHTVCYH